MLKTIRKSMRVIIWATAILFMLALLLGYGAQWLHNKKVKQTIAEVGKYEIPLDQFNRTYNNIFNRTVESGSEITPELEQEIAQQTIDHLVETYIISDMADKYNLKVSEAELEKTIRSFPVFKDGFSEEKYRMLLAQANMSPAEFEENLREQLLAQKAVAFLSEGYTLTDSELKYIYTEINTKATAEYILVTYEDSYEEVEYDDEKLEEYYKENKDRYYKTKQVKIKYCELPVKLTEKDNEIINTKIDDIYKRLDEGEDFENLAMEYSDDLKTAPEGGDLGFFEKGMLVKEFEEAVFALKDGEVSKPVETEYGKHIIKRIEAKTEDGKFKVNAKHILIKIEINEETRDEIKRIAYSIYDSSEKDINSFETIANSFGYTVKDTDFFTEENVPIIDLEEVFEYMPDEKIGFPLYDDVNDMYIAFIIDDVIPPHYPRIDEIREIIVDDYVKENSIPIAKQGAEQLIELLNSSEDIQAILDKDNLELITSKGFSIGNPIDDLEGSEKISTDLFFQEQKKFDIYDLDNGILVAILIKRDIPDISEDFSFQAEYMKYIYSSGKKSAFQRDMFKDLKKDYKVTTYLDRYFNFIDEEKE